MGLFEDFSETIQLTFGTTSYDVTDQKLNLEFYWGNSFEFDEMSDVTYWVPFGTLDIVDIENRFNPDSSSAIPNLLDDGELRIRIASESAQFDLECVAETPSSVLGSNSIRIARFALRGKAINGLDDPLCLSENNLSEADLIARIIPNANAYTFPIASNARTGVVIEDSTRRRLINEYLKTYIRVPYVSPDGHVTFGNYSGDRSGEYNAHQDLDILVQQRTIGLREYTRDYVETTAITATPSAATILNSPSQIFPEDEDIDSSTQTLSRTRTVLHTFNIPSAWLGYVAPRITLSTWYDGIDGDTHTQVGTQQAYPGVSPSVPSRNHRVYAQLAPSPSGTRRTPRVGIELTLNSWAYSVRVFQNQFIIDIPITYTIPNNLNFRDFNTVSKRSRFDWAFSAQQLGTFTSRVFSAGDMANAERRLVLNDWHNEAWARIFVDDSLRNRQTLYRKTNITVPMQQRNARALRDLIARGFDRNNINILDEDYIVVGRRYMSNRDSHPQLTYTLLQ